jgi:hypothetical protein
MQPASPSIDSQSGTWTPAAGLHLHWQLPDALATQRKYPGSDIASFPKVPNRWLIILSTKTGEDWQQANSWVVESDYLHAAPQGNPQPCTSGTISFPIAPPDQLIDILNATPPPPTWDNGPTPQDVADYPFYYQAPFRCMGRKTPLSAWQADTAQHEYLPTYNPTGLTAVGYGHPLFSAIYSNCSSVFGCHDPASDGVYPRRYDVIGWYDDPANDCMTYFQDIPGQSDPWKALKSEYHWTADTNDTTVPSLSVYWARVDLPATLSVKLPSAAVNVTVGNTTTEALSAYLADSMGTDSAAQQVIEEQLEAVGMQAQLNSESIDLAARFEELRHDKAFKKIHGGSLWSVRLRHTSGQASTPSQEATLPAGLAHLIDQLNSVQHGYDNAWNQIETLQQRAFADWYRYASKLAEDDPALPELTDILAYSRASVLQPLQTLAAATGSVAFGKDAAGHIVATATDAGFGPGIVVQYTTAQALVRAVQTLSAKLAAYNASPSITTASLEYYLVRKAAPRFYQPTDPAVVLDGPAITAMQRNGPRNQLGCAVLDGVTIPQPSGLTGVLRSQGVLAGPFQTITSEIETLAAAGGAGFKTQTIQPWNPVFLAWQATIWPETGGTGENATQTAVEYDPDYLGQTYAFDVDACDMKIKVQPSQLKSQETAENYYGRAILTSHAPTRLRLSVTDYLMGLTLYALKQGGLRGQTIDAETDYQYDTNLFAWTASYFETPAYSGTLADPSTLSAEALAEQQNEVSVWLKAQYPFRLQQPGEPVLIDLSALSAGWSGARPMLGDGGVLTTLQNLTASEQIQDPVAAMVNAYLSTGSGLLAQALSGFNDALLTRQRDMQLPVWDYRTMMDADAQGFARDIALSLGADRTAPRPDTSFLPFRAGLMQIPSGGLTLVDSFGQYLPLTFTSVSKSQRMTLLDNLAASVSDPTDIATAEENSDYIYLPPRLVQETRLNFRWLAADQGNAGGSGDEVEMNDHPATTPVCGWLLPNNLDGSLAVYSTNGLALGSLTPATDPAFAITWQPAPGLTRRLQEQAIANPHLNALVSALMQYGSTGGSTVWDGFLASINTALRHIDPKNFAEHEALALLIGRPMAVVRATLGLQLKGMPAVDNSAAAFTYDQTNNMFTRLTNGFDAVTVPIRLGEAKQLDDGLVSYWLEDGRGGFTGGPHFPELEQQGRAAEALSLSVSDPAVKLTMLLDPRGCVHATTGILPVKTLTIPSDQYAKSLRALSISFLTAPVIAPLDGIELPLPTESGYGWSWLDQPASANWKRIADIAPASRYPKYAKQRIVEGWLQLSPQARKSSS